MDDRLRNAERDYKSSPSIVTLQQYNSVLVTSGQEAFLPIEYLQTLFEDISRLIKGRSQSLRDAEPDVNNIRVAEGIYTYHTPKYHTWSSLPRSGTTSAVGIKISAYNVFGDEHRNAHLTIEQESTYRNQTESHELSIYPDDVIYGSWYCDPQRSLLLRMSDREMHKLHQFTLPLHQPWVYSAEGLLDFVILHWDEVQEYGIEDSSETEDEEQGSTINVQRRNPTRTLRKHYRRNVDQDLRQLQRQSDDPEAEKRYLLGCLRVGKSLPIEDWYYENVYPLGIDEQDFKVLITQLVQGYRWITKESGQSMTGPRDWAWITRSLPDENIACFLAVRGTTRDRSNAEIRDKVITLGSTMYNTEGLASHSNYRWEQHPRNAWEYLRRYGYSSNAHPSPEIPTFFYTSFEKNHDLPLPVTPDSKWGHGCEIHGPDPCHADIPRQKMFGWARTPAPDRTTFSVFEARLYLGLDTEEGLPLDSQKRRNPDADIQALKRQWQQGDEEAFAQWFAAAARSGSSEVAFYSCDDCHKGFLNLIRCESCPAKVCEDCQYDRDPDLLIDKCRRCKKNVCTPDLNPGNPHPCGVPHYDYLATHGGGDHPQYYCLPCTEQAESDSEGGGYRRNPPLRVLEKFTPTTRKKPHHCEYPNCGQPTREGKIYCSEHVEELPYVQRVSSLRDAMTRELSAVKTKGKRAIPKNSLIIPDIATTLKVEGNMLQGDLAKAVGISFEVALDYFDQMSEWGMVEIHPSKRSNLIVFVSEEIKALTNLQETAQILGVAKSTIMSWVGKGAPHQTKISGPRGGRRRFYFSVQALKSWIDQQKKQLAQGPRRGKMVGLAQASKKLGIDKQSLIRWTKRGAPHLAERYGPKKGRVRYFFDIDVVKKWLKKEIKQTEIQGQLGIGVIEDRIPSAKGAPILLEIRNDLYLKQGEFANLLDISIHSLDGYMHQRAKTIPVSIMEKAQSLVNELGTIDQRVIVSLEKHGGKRSQAAKELGIGLAKLNQWIDDYGLHSHVRRQYAADQFTVSQLRDALTRTKGHRGRAAKALGITGPTLTRLMKKAGLDDEFSTGRKYVTWEQAQEALSQADGSAKDAAKILGIGKSTLSRLIKRHRDISKRRHYKRNPLRRRNIDYAPPELCQWATFNSHAEYGEPRWTPCNRDALLRGLCSWHLRTWDKEVKIKRLRKRHYGYRRNPDEEKIIKKLSANLRRNPLSSKKFGDNVLKRRKKLGLSLEKVAADSNIARQTLAQIERGVIAFPVYKVRWLAFALKCSPLLFFEGVGSQSPEQKNESFKPCPACFAPVSGEDLKELLMHLNEAHEIDKQQFSASTATGFNTINSYLYRQKLPKKFQERISTWLGLVPQTRFKKCDNCYLPSTGKELNLLCQHLRQDHKITIKEIAINLGTTIGTIKQYFYRDHPPDRFIDKFRLLLDSSE